MKTLLVVLFISVDIFFVTYGIVSLRDDVSARLQDCTRTKYAYMGDAIQTRADLKACVQKESK